MNTQILSSHAFRSIGIRETAAPAAREYGTVPIAPGGILLSRIRPLSAVLFLFIALTMAGCSAGEGTAQPAAFLAAASTTTPATATAAPETTGPWKTYTNPKYGYEIQFPLNWFNDTSDFNFQSYGIFREPSCAGGLSGVNISVHENPENLTAEMYLMKKLESPDYRGLSIQITSDRMGFAPDVEVVISTGYIGAGSPGPLADINTGRGQIIEIYTETMGFPVEKIFSTFRLIDANPNLQEFKTDVFYRDGQPAPFGDIGIINGDQTTKITDWGYDTSPLLSPDKTKIAYLSQTKEAVESGIGFYDPKSSNHVRIIGVDGSNPIQVTGYVPGISRGNLHWLDDNRLLFSDGKSSVKVYSLDSAQTSAIFDFPQPASQSARTVFLFNSDFTFLLWFPDIWGSTYEPIAIVDLASLQVTTVTDLIFPQSCRLEFGPDNMTFLGQREPLVKSDPAVLDLQTGKVTFDLPS